MLMAEEWSTYLTLVVSMLIISYSHNIEISFDFEYFLNMF